MTNFGCVCPGSINSHYDPFVSFERCPRGTVSTVESLRKNIEGESRSSINFKINPLVGEGFYLTTILNDKGEDANIQFRIRRLLFGRKGHLVATDESQLYVANDSCLYLGKTGSVNGVSGRWEDIYYHIYDPIHAVRSFTVCFRKPLSSNSCRRFIGFGLENNFQHYSS